MFLACTVVNCWRQKLLITIFLQAELSSPPLLPSQNTSCLRLGVLSCRFISLPYFRMGMCPGTQAKSSKFISMLMTASCMLSEFCSPPQLFLVPKPVELQDPADYRDLSSHEEWLCWKMQLGIVHKAILRSLFGKISKTKIAL